MDKKNGAERLISHHGLLDHCISRRESPSTVADVWGFCFRMFLSQQIAPMRRGPVPQFLGPNLGRMLTPPADTGLCVLPSCPAFLHAVREPWARHYFSRTKRKCTRMTGQLLRTRTDNLSRTAATYLTHSVSHSELLSVTPNAGMFRLRRHKTTYNHLLHLDITLFDRSELLRSSLMQHGMHRTLTESQRCIMMISR